MAVRQSKNASPFVERLTTVIENWTAHLPAHLQEDFREDFRSFGVEHDRMLDTLETIWNRRQRTYAFDESTGLARRGPFRDHLSALLHGANAATTRAIGVLFIDLDNLKQINDTCGHDTGDKALAAVGMIIRESIRIDRKVDFMGTYEHEEDYSASRHGGDEFLVALELTQPSDIECVAPRLKRSVDDQERQKARGYHASVRLTSSIGGVVYELPPTFPPIAANTLARELVRTADEQMYTSKQDGLVHIAIASFTDRLHVDHDYARIRP